MIDMARHMDVAMAGLSPSTWRLFSDLKLKLCFYVQQSCRLTFIQRDVVILESSAAETTTIQGTITFMVVDTGTSYQSITSRFVFSWSIWQKQSVKKPARFQSRRSVDV